MIISQCPRGMLVRLDLASRKELSFSILFSERIYVK